MGQAFLPARCNPSLAALGSVIPPIALRYPRDLRSSNSTEYKARPAPDRRRPISRYTETSTDQRYAARV